MKKNVVDMYLAWIFLYSHLSSSKLCYLRKQEDKSEFKTAQMVIENFRKKSWQFIDHEESHDHLMKMV